MKKVIISIMSYLLCVLYAINEIYIKEERIAAVLMFAMLIVVANVFFKTSNKYVLFFTPLLLAAISFLAKNYQPPIWSLFYLPVVILLSENKLVDEKNLNYFQISGYVFDFLCLYYVAVMFFAALNTENSRAFELKPLTFEIAIIFVAALFTYKKCQSKIQKSNKKTKDINWQIWYRYFAVLIIEFLFSIECSFKNLDYPPIELYAIIPNITFIAFTLCIHKEEPFELKFLKESMSKT